MCPAARQSNLATICVCTGPLNNNRYNRLSASTATTTVEVVTENITSRAQTSGALMHIYVDMNTHGIKRLAHRENSSGHRTAETVCSVKQGEEGLIIITGLDTGAAPELSLARPLSGDTHTHTLASTHTYIHAEQMGNQTSAPGKKNAEMVS